LEMGGGVQVAVGVVVVVLMAGAGVFPGFLAVCRGARGLVDIGGEEGDGSREGEGGGRDEEVGDGGGGDSGGGGGGGDGGDREKTVVEDGQQGNDGGLSGQRLAPEDGSPDDHGRQPQQAPWESEALDTRILQD
jgi:hypothetical protein